MKKLGIAFVVTVLLAVLFSCVVFAAAGEMPAAHGVIDPTFGCLVSELAQIDPISLAVHVSGDFDGENGAGMPAAHGLYGQEFGAAVSELAQEDPVAQADHVSDFAQGKSALHGLSGYAFCQLVMVYAPISDHVRL